MEKAERYNPKNFKTDQSLPKVPKCITDECNECTGSYVNFQFGFRLICTCKCHKITNVAGLTPSNSGNYSNYLSLDPKVHNK